MNRLLKTILATVWMGSCLATAQAQIYVVNRDAGTIGEYNADTGAVINASLVSDLRSPRGLALAGGDLFVTEYGDGPTDGRIGKYDGATGAAINATLVTGLTAPQSVAVSGNDLYVTSLDGQGTGMVGKYDATTGAAINALLVSRLPNPMGVGVTDNKLFVIYGSGMGAVGEFDATSGEPINRLFVPQVPDPNSLSLSDNNLWFVLSASSPYAADPKMDLIIWRHDRYLEVHASAPDRIFQVDLENYRIKPFRRA